MAAPHETESTAALRAAVDRFLARVGHWSQPRWAQPARDPSIVASQPGSPPSALASPEPGRAPTRADAVFSLVQELADAAADAEGQPRRQVPRLDNDLALPDQVRVMVADLLAAGAPDDAIHAAAARIVAVTAAL